MERGCHITWCTNWLRHFILISTHHSCSLHLQTELWWSSPSRKGGRHSAVWTSRNRRDPSSLADRLRRESDRECSRWNFIWQKADWENNNNNIQYAYYRTQAYNKRKRRQDGGDMTCSGSLKLLEICHYLTIILGNRGQEVKAALALWPACGNPENVKKKPYWALYNFNHKAYATLFVN